MKQYIRRKESILFLDVPLPDIYCMHGYQQPHTTSDPKLELLGLNRQRKASGAKIK